MRELLLPYGKETLKVEIKEECLAGVLVSELRDHKAPMEGTQLVQETLEHPIGTPRLCDTVIDEKKTAVISSDHTRPVPSHIIVPPILKGIHRGNPDADITIPISTGLHREATREELESKFGPKITEHETIIVHDCDDMDNMACLDRLPSGGDTRIDRLVMETDLLIVEGSIKPHFFAGLPGGRKNVLPGVTSRGTVMYNHSSASIGGLHSRTGIIEGNSTHNDMLYAARMAGLDFIVNVVIDSAYDLILTVTGDCDLAHRAGRDFLASKCQMDTVPADVVISTNGGYPLDQNIYQPVRGITVAEVTAKEGGIIIMLSKAVDDHGDKYFHETFWDGKDLNRTMRTFMDRKPEETIIDQQQPQIFTRVVLEARTVFVPSCDDKLVEELHMIPAYTVEEVLNRAEAMVNKEGYKVTVIPDDVSVIVRG